MADGTTLNAGAGGDTIATDDIGGQKYQRVKLIEGADGVNDGDISSSNPLPVRDPDVHTADFDTGAGTDTTPAFGVAIPASGGATVVSGGGGVEATALRVTVASDSTGVLSVDDNGSSLTVDNAQLSVVGGGTEATAMRVTIANDSTGVLSVDDNGGALTVDGTVTANAGTNLNTSALLTNTTFTDAFGTAGTADTQVLSVQGIASMTPVQVSQATATNLNAVVVGSVAHDTGSPGNPVVIAGSAQNMDDTAPPNQVSAESDVTRFAVDRDGALFVRPFGPRIWTYHEDSSSALTDTSVHAAPDAGFSLYVTDIVCSTGAATAMNIFFEEGASKVLGPYYLEAVAGRGLALHFQTPKKITAATALTVTTSAAIAHSIDVQGFIAQG